MWNESSRVKHPLYTTELKDKNNTTLEVATSDERDKVMYIGVKAKPKDGGEIADTFSFLLNQPFQYHMGINFQWYGLPDDHNPFPEIFRGPFTKLGEQVTTLKASLDECVKHLFKEGPRFVAASGNRYEAPHTA